MNSIRVTPDSGITHPASPDSIEWKVYGNGMTLSAPKKICRGAATIAIVKYFSASSTVTLSSRSLPDALKRACSAGGRFSLGMIEHAFLGLLF
ncbi:hypothetical protein PQR46_23540 [Paraburkholderia sediminicola]|uniref:hypothetical protein n=1 Tax=Paraburkholderia sediminicola TaxID=458836 RepID=UPI0038B7C4EE